MKKAYKVQGVKLVQVNGKPRPPSLRYTQSDWTEVLLVDFSATAPYLWKWLVAHFLKIC